MQFYLWDWKAWLLLWLRFTTGYYYYYKSRDLSDTITTVVGNLKRFTVRYYPAHTRSIDVVRPYKLMEHLTSDNLLHVCFEIFWNKYARFTKLNQSFRLHKVVVCNLPTAITTHFFNQQCTFWARCMRDAFLDHIATHRHAASFKHCSYLQHWITMWPENILKPYITFNMPSDKSSLLQCFNLHRTY